MTVNLNRIIIGVFVSILIIFIIGIFIIPEGRMKIIEPVFKYTKSVYINKALRCIPDGELRLICGGSEQSLPCCKGLQEISNMRTPDKDGTCHEVLGVCGSTLCSSSCGDGQCRKKENRCNCPQDCH